MQLPLNLVVGGAQWAPFRLRSKDPGFASFAEMVQQRDKHTCAYCSFKARVHMVVVNKDGIYTQKNTTVDNMVTACFLCKECLFIEASGRDGTGGGHLIYLPEMSQNDLNGLCHALFTAMALHTKFAEKSENIYNMLKLRAALLEKDWMTHASSPNFLGQMLLDTPFSDPSRIREQVLSPLRFLPSYEGFLPFIRACLASSPREIS